MGAEDEEMLSQVSLETPTKSTSKPRGLFADDDPIQEESDSSPRKKSKFEAFFDTRQVFSYYRRAFDVFSQHAANSSRRDCCSSITATG